MSKALFLVLSPAFLLSLVSAVPNQKSDELIKCDGDERPCQFACGFGSNAGCEEAGHCTCENPKGPSKRCRNVGENESKCLAACDRKIPQICYTDYGKLCSCFKRNY